MQYSNQKSHIAELLQKSYDKQHIVEYSEDIFNSVQFHNVFKINYIISYGIIIVWFFKTLFGPVLRPGFYTLCIIFGRMLGFEPELLQLQLPLRVICHFLAPSVPPQALPCPNCHFLLICRFCLILIIIHTQTELCCRLLCIYTIIN